MAKQLEKYCAFCGRAFDDPMAPWPRTCACGQITYRNPLPVVNVVVPVRDGARLGVLLIQRGFDPCRGQWAFPGGFMELNETWQAGAARELCEETGLVVADPDAQIQLLDAGVSAAKDELIVIGTAPGYTIDTLPPIPQNEEVLSWRVSFEPEILAFPAHTAAMKKFFERMGGK